VSIFCTGYKRWIEISCSICAQNCFRLSLFCYRRAQICYSVDCGRFGNYSEVISQHQYKANSLVASRGTEILISKCRNARLGQKFYFFAPPPRRGLVLVFAQGGVPFLGGSTRLFPKLIQGLVSVADHVAARVISRERRGRIVSNFHIIESMP